MSSNTPAPQPSYSPRRRNWLSYAIVAGAVIILAGGAYAMVKFTSLGSPKATPSPSAQPGVSTTERSTLGDAPSTGPSILKVTQVIADQGNIANVIAGALQVTGASSVGADLTVAGNVSANGFSGNGSALTGVNAALLNGQPGSFYSNAGNLQGTVSDAHLSANVALRGAPNTFSASNTFNGAINITGPASLTGSTTISSLILGSPLAVSSGGTGLATVTANGVLYGQGAGSLGVASPSAAGQCLLSTAGAPQFGVCPGGGGGVTSLDSLVGVVTLANSSTSSQTITIDDASAIAKGIASFDATDFSVTGGVVNLSQRLDVAATPTFAGLSLSAPLAVASGGTGAGTLAAGGVLIGQGTGAVTAVTAASNGLCLISGAGGPSFTTCPGSGGVVTINGLNGTPTVANSTNVGTAITINTADTAGTKGIASYNATDLKVTTGVVDTIQSIAVSATPTFAGLSLTTALPIGSGGTGSTTAAGARTNINAAVNGVNNDITQLTGLTTAISVAQGGTGIATTPTNGQILIGNGTGYSLNTISAGSGVTITNGSGTIQISAPSAGSCGTCANQALSNLAGVAINTTLLPSSAGGVDVGSTTLPFGQLVLSGSSASPSVNNFLITGSSTSGTRTINLPDSSGTVAVTASGPLVLNGATGNLTCPSCLTNGGGGGGTAGVTSVNSLNGAISIANSSNSGQTITLDDASTLVKGIAKFNSSDFSVSAGSVSLGTVSVGKGGTGLATAPSNGQLLIGNGSGYSLANLTNSDGTVTIANGSGSIDITVPRAGQCSTCADYTLDNLTNIVAINKSLLPGAAGAIDLGGPSVPYAYLYLAGSSATPGSNNFKLGGTATSARTINLPDNNGTLCLDATVNNCSFVSLQPGTLSPQTGGLSVTGNIVAGGSLSSATLSVGGNATVGGTLGVTGDLTVNSASTLTTSDITSAAGTALTVTSASGQALTLGSTSAGPTTLQGNSVSVVNGNDTLNFENVAGTNTYTVCTTHGNCVGLGGGITGSGTANTLPLFNGTNTLANSIVTQDAGGTKAIVGGNLDVTGSSLTGTGALSVSSTGGSNALTLSSGSGTIVLGGSTATIQRAASSLALDLKAAATSTLSITNSNASNIANLDVEGGVNIGTGQAYQINGASINVGGTLSNVAYLDQANAFTNVGTTSFGGALTGGTYNGQTISSAASFTGTVSIAGANALTLGQAAAQTGAILFQNQTGSNTVTLKASSSDPASPFTLTLPSAIGSTNDCLKQTNGTGQLGFVSCSSGLGGSGTTNTIAMFNGTSSIANSLLTQPNGTTVAIQGSGNTLAVDGTISVGVNGASGSAGVVAFNDGSNPGRTVNVKAQQSGSGYTLLLPTTADVGSACLVLTNVSAGVDKIAGGSCAAGGSGGNVTATGTTNGHLALFTSNGPSYSAAASLLQDNGAGIGVNVAPQASYVLTVGSTSQFNVTDTGQLEIGTTGSNPLTLATNGNISNVGTLTSSGLIQSSAAAQGLALTGAPTNSATQSLLRIGSAIAGGNSSAGGGTYIGLNAPSSGAGSAADFLNFQAAGTAKLRVDSGGNFVTAGTYNGVALAQGSGQFTVTGGTGTAKTLTVTANSTIDQNLAQAASPTFAGLTITNKLAASQGGTGTDTSGASAGAALIFNATTGKFQANRITSSDGSVTVGNSDGNISLQVASCSSCANTTLSNLGTTSLNASLLAQTSVDLGSGTNPFRFLYVYGASGTPSSNNFKLTGTSSGGTRTITLPDATGTVCLDTNNCNYITLQASTPGSVQSGNLAVNGTVYAGTDLKSNGTLTVASAATLSSTLSVTSNITSTGGSIIGNTFTSNSTSNLNLAPSASHSLTLGGTGASQTTSIQGNTISFTNAAHAYTFNSSGAGSNVLCDDSGNCAGAGGGITGSGTTNKLPIFASSNTLTDSLISQDAHVAATLVTVSGKLQVSATNTSSDTLNVNNTSFTANNSNLANLTFKNNNSSVTTATVNGLSISPSGFANTNANANISNGINLSNVTGVLNNSFYAINVGTGYNDILRYNNASLINGSGLLQNAAFDSTATYTNLTKVGTLAVTSAGGLTLGVAGSTAGQLVVATTGSSVTVTSATQANPVALAIPADTNANDTFCLATKANCSATGAAGGDLSGTYPNPQVSGLAGTALSISSLSSNQLLYYNGSNWVNSASPTVSGTFTAANLRVTAGNSVDTSTAGALKIGNSSANAIDLGKTGSNILTTINGTALVKPTSGNDSTTAFQVQNAGGKSILTVDSTGGTINLGQAGASGLLGQMVFNDGTDAFKVTLKSGATTSNYSLALPTALGSSGNCLIDTNGSGALGFTGCLTTSTGVQLQGATPGSQQTGNLNVSGVGIFGTAVATASLRPVTDGTTALNFQNAAGTVTIASIDSTNSQLVIGSVASGNYILLNPANGTSTGGIQAFGTAQHAKSIVLTPEFAGAVLDSINDTGGTVNCNTANAGIMTSGLDLTNRMNYYNWTASGSAQCYDVVVQVPIPSDWAGWPSTTPISVQIKTDSTANGKYAMEVRNSSGTAETNTVSWGTIATAGNTSWNGVSATTLGGSAPYATGYTAGGYFTIRVRLQSGSSANVQLGNITVNYLSKF